jgi:hypothetical protein
MRAVEVGTRGGGGSNRLPNTGGYMGTRGAGGPRGRSRTSRYGGSMRRAATEGARALRAGRRVHACMWCAAACDLASQPMVRGWAAGLTRIWAVCACMKMVFGCSSSQRRAVRGQAADILACAPQQRALCSNGQGGWEPVRSGAWVTRGRRERQFNSRTVAACTAHRRAKLTTALSVHTPQPSRKLMSGPVRLPHRQAAHEHRAARSSVLPL